jgi:hypothetical protein
MIEGVNDGTTNQMTLHTSAGCKLSPSNSVTPGGNQLGTECASSGGSNAGCAYKDGDTRSYGRGFNDIGGGVFVHLWAKDGIQMWYFPRGQIPKDITDGTPNPSTWGMPVASFSSTTCDMNQHFHDHVLTFDITLCGDWAGAAYGGGCPGTCAEAIANPDNFKSKADFC